MDKEAVRTIQFSRDQEAFRDQRDATPAAALLREIGGEQGSANHVAFYLTDAIERLQYDPSFEVLQELRHDIDEVYGEEKAFGTAFMDGALLELDIISRFAPHLSAGLYDSLYRHVYQLEDEHFKRASPNGYVGTSELSGYVHALVRANPGASINLNGDESALLSHVAKSRIGPIPSIGYFYLQRGFTIVRTQAERTNDADFARWDEARKLGSAAFTLTDSSFAVEYFEFITAELEQDGHGNHA